jgi:hypothetical protein
MSGLALIVGSVGMIITMSLHPTGRFDPGQVEPMLHKLIAVHALALACVPILFVGAWGMSHKMASPDRMAMAALAVYTFALLAVMNAAVADGLVTPGVIRQIVAAGSTPGAGDGWRTVLRYNFFVNQGFAQVFVVASSFAIGLWSIAILRSGVMARGLGIYGCLLGLATLVAMFSGRLHLDAHGFGMIIFGQAVWYIAAGASLLRMKEPAAIVSA